MTEEKQLVPTINIITDDSDKHFKKDLSKGFHALHSSVMKGFSNVKNLRVRFIVKKK